MNTNKPAKELKKTLSALDIFCISSGAMISSGLFILPGLAFAKAGPAMIISYLLATLFCLPALFSMVELTTAMPKAGGDYFYIMRGFGSLFGTTAGFCSWFSVSLKSAFALIGMATYLSMFTPFSVTTIALFCCLFFILFNLVGIKEASRLQVLLVIGLIGILITYVILGIKHLNPLHYSGFFDQGAGAVFATASLVFISFGGLTKAAAVAEETDNPRRNIPLGMFWAYAVTSLFYGVVAFITVGGLPPDILQNSLTPISDGAKVFGGKPFEIILSIGAFLAFVTTANAGIMTASRYPLAMSRDKLLPPIFKKLSWLKTPYVSVLFTGLFIFAAILYLKLELLVKVASSILILLFIIANSSLIIFRASKTANYHPKFKSPLYPYLQIFGILGGIFLLIEMGTFIVFLTMAFLFVGIAWHEFYVKPKETWHNSALMVIMNQITAKGRSHFSKELLDEFQHSFNTESDLVLSETRMFQIVESSKVIELNNSLSETEFYAEFSNRIGEKLPTIKTEHTGSIAVIQMTAKDSDPCRIVIVKAKEGIMFEEKKAHLLFVLISSTADQYLQNQMFAAIVDSANEQTHEKPWAKELSKENWHNFFYGTSHFLVKAFKKLTK